MIKPPIQPDTVGIGVASDHSVAVAKPNQNSGLRTGFSRKETRTRRVVLASGMALLGLYLACFDWQQLHVLPGVDGKLDYVNSILFSAQEAYVPWRLLQ